MFNQHYVNTVKVHASQTTVRTNVVITNYAGIKDKIRNKGVKKSSILDLNDFSLFVFNC